MMFNRSVNNEYVKVIDCGVGSTSNPNIGIGTEKDRSRSGTYGLVTKNAIIIRISESKRLIYMTGVLMIEYIIINTLQ